MKNLLAFNGSPRKQGNTSLLLERFIDGAQKAGSNVSVENAYDLNIQNCIGCLRCNILKRCSLRDENWNSLSADILAADVLVFATPIYFHHVTAPLKTIIDRFRSFVHVQITESGIHHTPHTEWDKDFVLILPMGSSDDIDAQPVIDLFQYMCDILGPKNRLHVIKGTRLAVAKHVSKTKEELEILYPKMNMPIYLAKRDAKRNAELLEECYALGVELCKA